MTHNISLYDFELDDIEEWLSGDDRVLAFVVQDADGNPVDITNATVEWRLFARPYEDDAADAVLDGSDSGVEIVTDSRVDTSQGEFEVRLDGSATSDKWGTYWHRPIVTTADSDRASWRGRIVLTA